MTHAELTPPLRSRLAAAVMVTLLHLALVMALIQAFAPRLGAAIVRPAMRAFDVVINAPPPPPPARPAPVKAGAAAPTGRKAEPRAITAPRPDIVLANTIAPSIVGTGADDTSGAKAIGPGAGAGGEGQGTGAGSAGEGRGGGMAKPIKIAGDIVSARDYPKGTRALRLGSTVTIALSVQPDGRPGDCRVVRPSRDPEADRITCRLALERFRFRPARDAAGQPVASVYGWQQRWFAP